MKIHGYQDCEQNIVRAIQTAVLLHEVVEGRDEIDTGFNAEDSLWSAQRGPAVARWDVRSIKNRLN